jgi:transforming growth factor-beta-induced protein
VATAQSVPALTSLVNAVVAANLVATLQSPGPFTVFAPVNDAFARLPTNLLANVTTKLTPTLTLHVLSGRYVATDLIAIAQSVTPTVTTVNGDVLGLSVVGSTLYLNGYAAVTAPDTNCTNGYVHLIDFVVEANVVSLVDVAVAANLSTLVSVVTAAGLAPTFSGVATKGAFTLLAPSNAAFAALAAANPNLFSWVTASKNVASLVTVLQYHAAGGAAGNAVFSRSLTNGQVVSMLNSQTLKVGIAGAAVTFTDNQPNATVATVVAADRAAYNGVAHVIDRVLLPTGLPWATLGDVVAVASAADGLSSLVDALSKNGLVPALQAPAGPFTVLAPNNGAFSTFAGKYTDKASLTTILTQHVIVGRFYAADLKNGQVLNTLAGQTLKVSLIDSTVKFTSSSGSVTTVLVADVDSSNA